MSTPPRTLFLWKPSNLEGYWDKVKNARNIKIAQDGRVTLPAHPVEYGHPWAVHDHPVCGQAAVPPVMRAWLAAMMTAMFCLMRFDEVSNIL